MNLRRGWSPLRVLVLLIAGTETALAVWIVLHLLTSGISEEAKSINRFVAGLAASVYAVSGAPALGLALWGRWLWLAAAFAAVPIAILAARMAV